MESDRIPMRQIVSALALDEKGRVLVQTSQLMLEIPNAVCAEVPSPEQSKAWSKHHDTAWGLIRGIGTIGYFGIIASFPFYKLSPAMGVPSPFLAIVMGFKVTNAISEHEKLHWISRENLLRKHAEFYRHRRIPAVGTVALLWASQALDPALTTAADSTPCSCGYHGPFVEIPGQYPHCPVCMMT